MSAMQAVLLHLKTENCKISNEIILFLCALKVEFIRFGEMSEHMHPQFGHSFQ